MAPRHQFGHGEGSMQRSVASMTDYVVAVDEEMTNKKLCVLCISASKAFRPTVEPKLNKAKSTAVDAEGAEKSFAKPPVIPSLARNPIVFARLSG